jgi:hypothetical protein
MAEVEIHEE